MLCLSGTDRSVSSFNAGSSRLGASHLSSESPGDHTVEIRWYQRINACIQMTEVPPLRGSFERKSKRAVYVLIGGVGDRSSSTFRHLFTDIDKPDKNTAIHPLYLSTTKPIIMKSITIFAILTGLAGTAMATQLGFTLYDGIFVHTWMSSMTQL